MTQETEEWTGDEAYEHMAWCDRAVKKLRELSEEEALSWWKNESQKPDWLEIEPEDAESIQSFADRLEQEEFEWAETASVRYAEEKAAEEEDKKRARRTLEGGSTGSATAWSMSGSDAKPRSPADGQGI